MEEELKIEGQSQTADTLAGQIFRCREGVTPDAIRIESNPVRGEPLASFLIGILNLRVIRLGLQVKLIVKENFQPEQPSGPGDLKNRLNSIQSRIGR